MPQLIGVPRETAAGEKRVATVPEVVEKLIKLGFRVAVQSGAGEAANFSDDAYRAAGADIVSQVWDRADIVFKVRPPTPNEVQQLREGATLDVMPPMGHFGVSHDARDSRHYLGVAAGSGITPLVSIIASALATEPNSRFTLVFGNRASSSVMFRDELAALKDRYLDRFNLVHVLSREPQDIELLHGRIDRAKADALFERWVPVADVDYAFVCGPEGMMDAVRASLLAHGMPAERIKIERFAASIPKHTHVPRPLPQAAHTECEVHVVIDGSLKGKLERLQSALVN